MPNSKPVMTQENLKRLVERAPYFNIAGQFEHYDLSLVLPDVSHLATVFNSIPLEQREAFLQAVGKAHIERLFFPKDEKGAMKDWIVILKTEKDVWALFLHLGHHHLKISTDLKEEQLTKLLSLCKSKEDLDNLALVLRPQFNKLQEKIGNLSSFLNQIENKNKVNIDLFVERYINLDILANKNLIGDMKVCLNLVSDPTLRVKFIRAMGSNPKYLEQFDSPNELAKILEELDNTSLAALLLNCSDTVKKLNLLPLIIENRMKEEVIAKVLIKKYLNEVPDYLWVTHWKIIANHLAKTKDFSIFLEFSDEKISKEILDAYEALANQLHPLIERRDPYQRWVTRLLYPQKSWQLLGKFFEQNNHGSTRRDGFGDAIGMGIGLGVAVPVTFALVAVISIIGLIPAFIAGIIYLSKVRPIEQEIKQFMKANMAQYPDLSPEELLQDYRHNKHYHESLKKLRSDNSLDSHKNSVSGLNFFPKPERVQGQEEQAQNTQASENQSGLRP